MIRSISLLTVLISSFAITACYREVPETAEERLEENCMVQEVLRETSPRNMNMQPKAVPEFKTEPCCPTAEEIYRDKPVLEP